MRRSFAHVPQLLAGISLAFLLAGCATVPPPTGELAAAQQAVTRADGADADQYAGQDIALARDELSRAQAAMSAGKDDEARQLALAAAADADLAHARSRAALATAELARRRAEVDELRQRLQEQQP